MNDATWLDFESMDAETLASVMNAITTESMDDAAAVSQGFGFGMDPFLVSQQQAHAMYQYKAASAANKAAAAGATTTANASSVSVLASPSFPSMYEVEQRPDPNQVNDHQRQSNRSWGTWELASHQEQEDAAAVLSNSTSSSSCHRSHPPATVVAAGRIRPSSKGGSSSSSSTPSTTTTTAATTATATASARSPREIKRYIEKSHKRRLRGKTATITTPNTTTAGIASQPIGDATDTTAVHTSSTTIWDDGMFKVNVAQSMDASMSSSSHHVLDVDSNGNTVGGPISGGSSSILAFTHEPPSMNSLSSFLGAEDDTIHPMNVPQRTDASSSDALDGDSNIDKQGSSSILAFTHEPPRSNESSLFPSTDGAVRQYSDDVASRREREQSKSQLEESLTSLPDLAHLFSAFRDQNEDEEQPPNKHHHHRHHKHANKTKKPSTPRRNKQQLQDPSVADTNITSASIQTAVMSGSKKQMHMETRAKQKKQRKERVKYGSSKTIDSKLSTKSLPLGPVGMEVSTNHDLVGNLHNSAPIRMESDNSWANFDHVTPPPSSRDDTATMAQHHHDQQMQQFKLQPPSSSRPHRINSLPLVLRAAPIRSPSVATIASDPYHSLDRYGGTGAQLKFCMTHVDQQSASNQDQPQDEKEKQQDSKSSWMVESYGSEEWNKTKEIDIPADVERPETFDSYYKKPVHAKVEEHDNAYWLSFKNNEKRPKCWKSKWMIAGFVVVLLACGIGVGLYLGLKPKQSSSTSSSSSSGDCAVNDLPRQCAIAGRISTFPTCVQSRYDDLKVNFLPNLNPNFDADEDSCASGNVALINLAATTTGDESVKELENTYLLSVLYFATEGRAWFNSNVWASEEPYCSWWGVLCDENLDVIELDLDTNNLVGTLPAELGLLFTLQNLTLAGNAIGSTIPSEIGMLSSLVSVDVHGNMLEGTLPVEMGRLTALDRMDFSFNKLRGSIPAALGDLSSLVNIYLNNNVLAGQIPSEIQYCRNLLSLILNSNALSGTVPSEFGALSNIETIELANNLFSDTTIPSELGVLSTLVSLNMDGSNIVGTIPSELGNLSSLLELQLGSSTLSGTIPTELGRLERLVRLNVNLNRLTGGLPSEFGEMRQLTQLDLSYNRMTGTLPTELGLLTNLSVLMVGGNFFVGQVPSQVCSLWDADLNVFIGDYCSGEYLNCTADPTCCPGC